MRNLSNITLRELRAILAVLGLTCEGTKGGHEKWSKPGLERPIVFQTHVKPIPEFVIKNIIRDLGITRQDFINLLEKK